MSLMRSDLVGLGVAESAAIDALALGVGDIAFRIAALELLPAGEPRFLRGGEVFLQHLHEGSYVGIGIENLVTVLRHGLASSEPHPSFNPVTPLA
jgi:hypothetical protein